MFSIIVAFSLWLLLKSDGFTAKRSAEYKGVAIFDQCSYNLGTVLDRGIFTIEDECKVACALSNRAAFDDLE